MFANFFHADCVDDQIDIHDYYKYEDVYLDGYIDVGDSSTTCDKLGERVGYNDGSLSAMSKDVFPKDVVLDADRSSLATYLSFVLKKKGKIRVNFTRKILNRSKMLSLGKGVRSHKVKGGVAKRFAGRSKYGSLVSFIGLNEDEIPALEEIYDNPTDGIFTNASYDDEGVVADFTNLE
ncbi:hypothetical protein Tco_1233737 [Tanacetum coccineum]